MSDKEIAIGQDGNGDGDCGHDEEIVAERDQHFEEESFTSATHSINPLSHSRSDLSNSSNWQNSGLTRSEVEFSRKKQGSCNQESSSSSMILKITSNENSEDEYPLVNTPRTKEEEDYATSNGNEQPKELSNKSSSQNSVSTSSTVWVKIHPNKKGHDVIAKSKGIQTGHSISKSIIRDRLKEKIKKHRDKYQVDFDMGSNSNKEKRQKDKRHENHHHGLSNIHRKPFKSLTNNENSSCSKSKSNINFESESEMSATCQHVTEQVLRLDPSSSQKKKNELLKAVDLHRERHISKVRTEIQKLEILNKLLLAGKMTKSAISNSSSKICSESESDADNTDSNSNHSNIRNRCYRSRPLDEKVDYKLKHHNSNLRNSNLKSTQNENKSKSNSSLSLSTSREKQKVMTRIYSTSDGKIDKDLTFEEKLEKLLSAFDKLTGNRSLIENSDSSSADEENYSKRLEQKLRENKYKNYKKESVPCKPSISYYIPIKKPHLANTNIEIDETDDEFKKEKEIPNVQEAFEMGNQSFLNRAKEREKIISDVKEERKRREEIKRNWAYSNLKYSNGIENENNDNLTNLNLPPRGPAIMSVKEMKELTQKNYRKLPEVQEKIHQQIMDQEKRTNRFMSQLFANNLRRNVLKGQMNVEHYRSLIRN